MVESTTTPLLSGKVYDYLNYLVKYVLPGGGTLYFTLATIWGLEYGEQVVGTLAAVTIFLSLLLGFSKRSYNASDEKYDGRLVVDTSNPLKDTYSLEVTTPLEEVSGGKTELVLKIQNSQTVTSQ